MPFANPVCNATTHRMRDGYICYVLRNSLSGWTHKKNRIRFHTDPYNSVTPNVISGRPHHPVFRTNHQMPVFAVCKRQQVKRQHMQRTTQTPFRTEHSHALNDAYIHWCWSTMASRSAEIAASRQVHQIHKTKIRTERQKRTNNTDTPASHYAQAFHAHTRACKYLMTTITNGPEPKRARSPDSVSHFPCRTQLKQSTRPESCTHHIPFKSVRHSQAAELWKR